MSDSEPKNDPANPSEPVMSKPYIMPDDPEPTSAEALAKEAADARDKMLRTLAEMENLRKRTAREVSDARTYGVTGFARDVLDIADNLQRALDAVPAEARANAEPGLKSLPFARVINVLDPEGNPLPPSAPGTEEGAK